MCLSAFLYISFIPYFSWLNKWSLRPWLTTSVLEVGIIISVGSTTSAPYAKWKGDNLVECLVVVLYDYKTTGNFFVQFSFAFFSLFFIFSRSVLFVDSDNPFSCGWYGAKNCSLEFMYHASIKMLFVIRYYRVWYIVPTNKILQQKFMYVPSDDV